MRVTITGPFATAKDTAKILGVSDKRLKELQLLRSSGRLSGPKKNGWALDLAKNGSKVSRTKSKTSANKRRASAPRKRRARGKSAKALA
jgi:hypothetical protein